MKMNDKLNAKDELEMNVEYRFSDSNSIKGHLTVNVFDRSGKLLQKFDFKNLVVNTGKTAAARTLGSLTANKQVTQFGVGTGAVAPLLTDVAPLTTQFKKAISAVSYPDTSSVLFDWTIEFAEANGLTITEFGLFCVDNSLFSRVVSGSIAKHAAIRLTGSWKITF